MITAAASAETVWLGLRLYELLTLAGVFAGPLSAVLITLWIENRRRKSDARTQILRMILTTRRLFSEPAYVMAINLIEVEFNDCADVMKARREYLDMVSQEPSGERRAEHEQRMLAKQSTMIARMMKAIGLKASESELLTDAYISKGFIARDSLYLDSLVAMRDVASALRISNLLMAQSMGVTPPPATEEERTQQRE